MGDHPALSLPKAVEGVNAQLKAAHGHLAECHRPPGAPDRDALIISAYPKVMQAVNRMKARRAEKS